MSVLDVFFGPGNELTSESLSEVGDDLGKSVERWRQGIGPSFLPRRSGARLFWYGLMDDDLQRREVQLLLRHHVGPSCSDVVERQGALDADDPFDQDLDRALPGRVVRLEVWPRSEGGQPAESSQRKVKDRLGFLVRLMDVRPPRATSTAVSLPALMDELDLAATSGEAARAFALLDDLERRRLLDAPNTTFIRIRVLALLGRYDEVMSDDVLATLADLRLPPGVVRHVGRAAYESTLRRADVEGDLEELLQRRAAWPPVLRHVLRQGASSPDRPNAVARAVAVGNEPGMAALLLEVLPDEAHLRALLGPALGTEIPTTPPLPPAHVPPSVDGPTEPPEAEAEEDKDEPQSGEPSLDLVTELSRLRQESAHEAVLELALSVESLPRRAHDEVVLSAIELDNESAARGALRVLERDLGPVEAIEWSSGLLKREVARFVEMVRTDKTEPAIVGWAQWFEVVSSGATVPSEALTGAADWNPMDATSLLDALQRVEDARPVAKMLGTLLAAHENVLDETSRGELARTVLTVLAVSDRSDEDVRLAAREMVIAVLDSGLTDDEVSDLLDEVMLLVGSQLSIGTLPWALDLMVELTGELAVRSKDALVGAWTDFLGLVRVFATTVARARWLELELVLSQVDMVLPPDIAATLVAEEGPDPLACVDGKKILLYSLRERSARQAAARLRSVGAEVTIVSDHGGSPRLGGQVEGSDLVVIVTAAAKHAATNFIEATWRSEPIRVNSAGMTSILTAMEDLCAA